MNAVDTRVGNATESSWHSGCLSANWGLDWFQIEVVLTGSSISFGVLTPATARHPGVSPTENMLLRQLERECDNVDLHSAA